MKGVDIIIVSRKDVICQQTQHLSAVTIVLQHVYKADFRFQVAVCSFKFTLNMDLLSYFSGTSESKPSAAVSSSSESENDQAEGLEPSPPNKALYYC